MTIVPALLSLVAFTAQDPGILLLERVLRSLERAAGSDGRTREALADACLLRGLAGPGAARAAHLERAASIYAGLSAHLGRPVYDEPALRVLWKYAGALALSDLPRLRRFYEAMTLRGHAPRWDADAEGRSRWGYRERLEALRPR